MSTLHERLADPHGYNKPLFPKAVAELSHAEQWEDLREVKRALWCNVWQATSQMEAVKEREALLQDSISRYIAQQKVATPQQIFERMTPELVVNTLEAIADDIRCKRLQPFDLEPDAIHLRQIADWLEIRK